MWPEIEMGESHDGIDFQTSTGSLVGVISVLCRLCSILYREIPWPRES